MEELKPYVKSGNSITIGVYFWQATVKVGSHMSKNHKLSEDSSAEDILEVKRLARIRLIDAFYAADQESLELATKYVKAALRGKGSIPRPKRFSSLGSDD